LREKKKRKEVSAEAMAATRRALLQSFPSAFKPQQANGKWWKPAYSARKMARFRKAAHESGAVLHSRAGGGAAEFGFDRGERGKKSRGWNANAPAWDTAWDRPLKSTVMAKPKGHIRDRTRGARFDKISESLTKMDDTVAEYRQEVEERKPLKTLRAELKMLD
jgi:hypothetical protein